jgi:GT2 family glycosyltransferase
LENDPVRRGADLAWIVVAHDSAPDLRLMLPSLRRELAALAATCGWVTDLIVADNASSDGGHAVVSECAPEATILRHRKNLGFGAAINRAAERTDSKWLAFSNADLWFPPGKLAALPDVLGGLPRDVGLVGPAVCVPGGAVEGSVGNFPTLLSLIGRRVRPANSRVWLPLQKHRSGPVGWVTGACMIVRRDVFMDVGGFDEGFFLYYEDVDLAHRFADRGSRAVYAPSLSVVHVRPHHRRPHDAHIEPIIRHSRLTYFRRHRPAWESRCLAALNGVEAGLQSWLLRSGSPARAPSSVAP